mmetsp:Transcript_39843/g.158452  ORF Transcript_39843/g.158452 Transcript_39843/m.158452 type:complete len:343 (-) Transcript_39843:957-1985(-)
MADRKATNKYYPPEYFDEYLEKGGKGGINTFRGEHPLRERAKKLKDGILRVRFEMPFNIWCNGCENHIGKGVRYNADKSKVGNYHSTPIYSFRMKCHLCDNYIEIRTDPQARDYVVYSGGKRKVEEWTAADAETIDLSNVGTAEGDRGGVDPFASLEKEVAQLKKAEEGKKRLNSLKRDRDSRFRDDYASSQRLRSIFRTEKKAIAEKKKEDDKLKKKLGVSIPLATPKASDAEKAKSVIASRINQPIRKRERSTIFSRSRGSRSLQASTKRSLAEAAASKLRRKGVDVSRLQGRKASAPGGRESVVGQELAGPFQRSRSNPSPSQVPSLKMRIEKRERDDR